MKRIGLLWILLWILLILITVIVLWRFNKTIDGFGSSDDNITVVSGYWRVDNRHGHKNYDNWFKNTLKINQRYFFFCDEKDIEYLRGFRNNYETHFIAYPIDNFHVQKYAIDSWNDENHSRTKEIFMIWHEKIHMMKMAKDLDGKLATDFYIWLDSGIATYREKEPPQKRLNLHNINSLPHDKISYCDNYVPNDINSDNSKTDRNIFSAGCIIIHRDMIDYFHDLYYRSLNECVKIHQNDSYCAHEQRVLTDMVDRYPEIFNKMSSGWGSNIDVLFTDHV